MPINDDTHVERINLATEGDVKSLIENLCHDQAQRPAGRRLAGTFTVGPQLLLIFQRAVDNA